MKILLLGANGQLGTDLNRAFHDNRYEVEALTRRDLDVRAQDKVLAKITGSKSDVVVNTTAFHNVEECEKQPAAAFEVNAIAAQTLAQACDRAGCSLVHFSTDFVFDGRKGAPYGEEDLPHPQSVYATSKLAGEMLIAAVFERYYVIRTCGLYGLAGSKDRGGNFVEKMLKKAAAGEPIRVVKDQVLTPTYTRDLAGAVVSLIRSGRYGLYHATNEGECSWFDFARTIFELEKVSAQLSSVSTMEFSSPVKRPSYSVLSKQKLAGIGHRMPSWQDGLARYLRERGRKDLRGTTPS